jgi:hypothetical protein
MSNRLLLEDVSGNRFGSISRRMVVTPGGAMSAQTTSSGIAARENGRSSALSCPDHWISARSARR